MASSMIITRRGLGLWWTSLIFACLSCVDCAPKSCPGSRYYFDKHTGRRECCDQICRHAVVTGFQEECDKNCHGYPGSLGQDAQALEPVLKPEPFLSNSGDTDYDQGRTTTTIAIPVAVLFVAVAVAALLYRCRHRWRLPRALTLAIAPPGADIHAASNGSQDEESPARAAGAPLLRFGTAGDGAAASLEAVAGAHSLPIQAQGESHDLVVLQTTRPPVPETSQNAAGSQFAGLGPTH